MNQVVREDFHMFDNCLHLCLHKSKVIIEIVGQSDFPIEPLFADSARTGALGFCWGSALDTGGLVRTGQTDLQTKFQTLCQIERFSYVDVVD